MAYPNRIRIEMAKHVRCVADEQDRYGRHLGR